MPMFAQIQRARVEFTETGVYDEPLLVSRAVPLLKWLSSAANESFDSIRLIKFEGDVTAVDAPTLANVNIEKIKNRTI